MQNRNIERPNGRQSSAKNLLSAFPFFWAALALTLLLLVGRPAPIAAQTTVSCANTAAIPNPEPASLVSDCNTLLAAKDTLRGSATLNWSTSRPIDQWEGITISRSNVTLLRLRNRSLTGKIPSQLGSLSHLRVLDFTGNQLTGKIPAELGNLSQLQNLRLRNNQLTGSIPVELGRLSNLQTLHLRGNHQLSGCIPASLRAVVTNDLAQLRLSFCGQTSGSTTDEDPEQGAGERPAQMLYLSLIQK